ncbi:hypothetical protein GF312_02120 [Candidatus Poribacteria bacterium]|nr:hypothetical protein [Candidatus Poribacteria bacterium]
MSLYPESPNLPQGTNSTEVNTTNWNKLIDNINAIGSDLVNARGDGQEFPGIDHSSGQCGNIDDILQGIKHMISDISGEDKWYDSPIASLRSHDHSHDKGGNIPWSSIGSGNRRIVYHPEYPGALWTASLHGDPASGNNTLIRSCGQEVELNVAHNYYGVTTSEDMLQEYYLSLCLTLPEDFSNWSESDSIKMEYKTYSDSISDNGVGVYVYKSGTAESIVTKEFYASNIWSNISLDRTNLGSWSSGDTVEIYVWFTVRDGHFARLGKIEFNYES